MTWQSPADGLSCPHRGSVPLLPGAGRREGKCGEAAGFWCRDAEQPQDGFGELMDCGFPEVIGVVSGVAAAGRAGRDVRPAHPGRRRRGTGLPGVCPAEQPGDPEGSGE
jgi:hypothetical protein